MLFVQEGEIFEKLDREADEWRAKEIAKDMAQQKVHVFACFAVAVIVSPKYRLSHKISLETA